MMPSGPQIAICITIAIVIFGAKPVTNILKQGFKELKDFRRITKDVD